MPQIKTHTSSVVSHVSLYKSLVAGTTKKNSVSFRFKTNDEWFIDFI